MPRRAAEEERKVVDEIDRITAALSGMVSELQTLIAAEQERLQRLYGEGGGG